MTASIHEIVMRWETNRVIEVLLVYLVPFGISGKKKPAEVNGRYPGGEESGSGSVWQFQKDGR